MTRNDISTANYFIDEVYSKLTRYIDMDVVMERLELHRNWAEQNGDEKAEKYNKLLNSPKLVTDIAQSFRERYEKWRYDEMVETIDETIAEFMEEDIDQEEDQESPYRASVFGMSMTANGELELYPQHGIDCKF